MAILNLLPLSYRRPAFVERPETSASQISTQQSEDGSVSQADTSLKSIKSGSSGGIPPPLSFDRIIEGGTCPPCTVRDFMNYLIYVERSAENLQFYLWHRDFEKRFNEAQTPDLALAPEWTPAMEEEAIARIKKEQAKKARVKPSKPSKPTSPAVTEIFKGTDFEKPIQKPSVATTIATTPISPLAGSNDADPFGTPPRTPSDRGHHYPISTTATTYNTAANEAFALAGLKAPFTVQPFRVELDRIIATYIMSGSPRQLNLSDREQKAVLQALCFTTHPSALRVVVKSVESTLRQQAHPNFIRWSICNGNPVRVTFARCLGVGTVALSTIAAIVLTLSSVARGWRALAAIGWVIGIATLMAAYKGMCVVLHGLHHRHVRPWELFVVDEEEHQQGEKETNGKSETSGFEDGSNSFENEPWVVKYEKRNLIRKIFDREVWVQEPALRQIQDTIFLQSLLFAFICAGVLTAIFVPLSGGNLF
ncbi:hypothetical protein QBC36DRAFT_98044 [Triangularia setosa]|uniref:Regulator of G protein signaling superfamily n=1 Tax=Triangularia setosa TaxID=2587417 RepID=A0AAN6WH96_9PEZI|nr:hypothetical protein QBC36DRAFT_98044 [Podospora setosa]